MSDREVFFWGKRKTAFGVHMYMDFSFNISPTIKGQELIRKSGFAPAPQLVMPPPVWKARRYFLGESFYYLIHKITF